jgi:hypothetical protein
MTHSNKLIPLFSLFLPLISGCGGSPANGDSSNGLYINAALGVTLTQSPIRNGLPAESGVSGLVFVTRDNPQGPKVAATLTVNGAAVSQDGFLLAYDLGQTTIPNATAGGAIRLHASYQSYSADLTLHCPAEVSITAPADNALAMIGDSLPVSWKGSLDYASIAKPDIMVRGFDPASGERNDIGFVDRVESGKANDTVPLPDPKGAPQWLVDLYVPGDAVNDAAGAGFCMLDRRVHLVKK